ncbi:MAG: alpha/beta hydrolase, partial [Rhizobiales bacterium]|nr:alpha/beta hydrolase [Hyphomicrobiales bacterium]
MLSKEVVSGNVVLAVETVGERDAPAIVLCQGLGMRVADWPARLIEGLARDFFVVLVDNRDTGRSGRAAVPYTLFDMAADIER